MVTKTIVRECIARPWAAHFQPTAGMCSGTGTDLGDGAVVTGSVLRTVVIPPDAGTSALS